MLGVGLIGIKYLLPYTYYLLFNYLQIFKYIGLFATEIEAAIAYDNEVVKVFGEFATTNKGMGLI